MKAEPWVSEPQVCECLHLGHVLSGCFWFCWNACIGHPTLLEIGVTGGFKACREGLGTWELQGQLRAA